MDPWKSQPNPATYNGLTIVLDKPSRFDVEAGRLLSGAARDWFEDAVGICLNDTEIRLASDRSSLLPGTRHVVLSGATAIESWTHGRHSLNDHGYDIMLPFAGQLYPAVGVHYIQDCMDFTAQEWADDDEDDDEEAGNTNKDTAVTRRGNYPFWTSWSVRKLLGRTIKLSGSKLEYKFLPRLTDCIQELLTTTGALLYLDIETHILFGTLECVGYRINDGPVKVVPVYRYDGKLAYTQLPHFLRALSVAMCRNTVVGHNISGFDLPYLALFYRVRFGRNLYDTMLANHRLFAEVEKSLGHIIGQWTDYDYHKNEYITPRTRQDEERFWLYNAKDVWRLAAVRDAQLQYATITPGAADSIANVNRCIYHYLMMSLNGIPVDGAKLAAVKGEAMEKLTHLKRVGDTLMGYEFNPASSKQCIEYFHTKMGYPPVGRSEKTGLPSLGKKLLYVLASKHNNPMIPFTIRFRKQAKDISMLNFKPLTRR